MLLSDAVGMNISLEETESSVGIFNVDIYAVQTDTGRRVIIENQLEDTNHDHLGKLITYAAGKSADVVIWLVKHAREEHRSAIEWLNNHTDENTGFFLLKIKLFRIGNSAPAVKFEVLKKPNTWAKEIKNRPAAIPEDKREWSTGQPLTITLSQTQPFRRHFTRAKQPPTTGWISA